jgi:hypothetical protein
MQFHKLNFGILALLNVCLVLVDGPASGRGYSMAFSIMKWKNRWELKNLCSVSQGDFSKQAFAQV